MIFYLPDIIFDLTKISYKNMLERNVFFIMGLIYIKHFLLSLVALFAHLLVFLPFSM